MTDGSFTSAELWSRLSELSIGLGFTLLAYLLALWLFKRSGQSPLLNPVMIGMTLVIIALSAREISYESYFAGAQHLHFLLGTATVALAIPLYNQIRTLRALLLPILLSVVAGTATAAASTIVIASFLGASELTLLSIAPKSTTTPVAMGIAEGLGGLPSLAAVAVILTGIFGAVFGLGILRLSGIRGPEIQGVALGVAAHGIGTARALQVDQTLGAYAGLAMGLSALSTAALVPAIWHLLGPLLL